MAIKVLVLKDVTRTTVDGVVTVSGTTDEKGLVSAVTEVVTMPFALTDEENFVSRGTAAIASLSHLLLGAHVVDFMHARRGAAPISPITKLFAPK